MRLICNVTLALWLAGPAPAQTIAALGDSLEDPTAISIITLCGALGLAALIPARMILAHYQKQDERDGQP